MGKTNWVILVLGLGACLALSLMMKQALSFKEEARRDPVVKGIEEIFGNRLDGRPRFEIEERQGRRVAVLTIRPRLNHASRHLARTLGSFAWRQTTNDRFDVLEVVAEVRDGEKQTFPIERPAMMRKFDPQHQAQGRTTPKGALPVPTRRAAAPPPKGTPPAPQPGKDTPPVPPAKEQPAPAPDPNRR